MLSPGNARSNPLTQRLVLHDFRATGSRRRKQAFVDETRQGSTRASGTRIKLDLRGFEARLIPGGNKRHTITMKPDGVFGNMQ